jgi:hypothetical protein
VPRILKKNGHLKTIPSIYRYLNRMQRFNSTTYSCPVTILSEKPQPGTSLPQRQRGASAACLTPELFETKTRRIYLL